MIDAMALIWYLKILQTADLPVKNDCVSSDADKQDDDVQNHKEISCKGAHYHVDMGRIVNRGLVYIKHDTTVSNCEKWLETQLLNMYFIKCAN